tara:strand:+ start:8651 stop:9055 length:405 start_codon:yes stop_codon:yes gene_type:complete
MSAEPLSIEDLRDLVHKGEIIDPLVFLESVMSGQDPRKLSSIYELISEIDNFTGGEISTGDWSEIVDHVSMRFKYRDVTMSESMNASKTLAEYLYAKRKQIEILDGDSSVSDIKANPLTEEEITLFKEKFNDEF